MTYRSYSSSHGLSESSRISLRGRWRSSRIALRGCWLVWGALAVLGGIMLFPSLWAGPGPQREAQTKEAPAKTPRPRKDKRPYLLFFEPAGVRTTAMDGPRLRRPPLLPAPRESIETASATPIPNAAGPAASERKSESVLSSDPLAPLIPVAKTPSAPTAPEPRPAEGVDNAITPAKGRDPDLKDAAPYFEAPIETPGARAGNPATPASPSPAPAQPESSATYQEKK
jgi:hypothetical protein